MISVGYAQLNNAFVYSIIQKTRGGGGGLEVRRTDKGRQKARRARACVPAHRSRFQRSRAAMPLIASHSIAVPYAPAPLEKLATAAASVSYTSNTVSSLVIC